MADCLKSVLGCIEALKTKLIKSSLGDREMPDVAAMEANAAPLITVARSGPDVTVDGLTCGGTGTAYASALLEQDSSYWEVRVEQAGHISIGVTQKAGEAALAGTLGDGKSSFGSMWGALELKEGDVVGVCLGLSDMPMLTFYKNGEFLDDRSVDRVKGDVCPAVSVGDGAQVKFQFSDFAHSPPSSKYTAVMIAREILRR